MTAPATPRRGLARRPAWRRAIRKGSRVLVVVALGLPLCIVTAVGVGLGALVYGIPGVGDLEGTVPTARPVVRAQPSEVYDVDGNKIGEFREFDLTLPMQPDDVPQVLKDAVVAAEDRSFWLHPGVDPQGLVRAAVENYSEGQTVQGGSTITQQLVRERYLSRDKTVERKFNEVLLATRFERDLANKLAAERHLDEAAAARAAKEQILFEYLDSVYFGAGAYGASAASQTYFHKNVRDLTVSEAALLAAVIPAPSKYGPRENLAVADQRRKDVLREMRDLGFIPDQAALDAALSQTLWAAVYGPPPGERTVIYPPPQAVNSPYPYYLDYIRTYVIEKYGPDALYRGGLRITAALDPRLQAEADRAVRDGLGGTAAPLEISLVSVDPPTGQVKALVGGRDFGASQVNLALGGIQGMSPGSSFKAFTVGAALEQGYSPETVYNSPGVFYVPGCSGKCGIRGGAGGPVTMRDATTNSYNTYFAQLILDLGPDNVAEFANRLGVSRITLNRKYTLGLTLGQYEVSPLDMAAGYAVFANHGVRADATPVATIVGPDGRVVEDNTAPHGRRVIAASVADTTTELLQGPIRSGTGTRAQIGRPVAGKTGTGQEYRAAWLVGYTPQLATAVWMGYADTPKPMHNIRGFGSIMGGTVPAIVFGQFMRAAHAPWPVIDFTRPGPLPPPSSGVRHAPSDFEIPMLPQDCGGPCVIEPTVLPPTTQPPEPRCRDKRDGELVDQQDPEGAVCVEGRRETTTTRPPTGAPTTTITVPRTTRGTP